MIPDKFKARFELFRWAVKGKSQSVIPPQGLGDWLREARRQVYKSCDFQGDCCRNCDDGRILDLFFLRFYSPDTETRVVEEFFHNYDNPDIFHLGAFCDAKDKSLNLKPSKSTAGISSRIPSTITVTKNNAQTPAQKQIEERKRKSMSISTHPLTIKAGKTEEPEVKKQDKTLEEKRQMVERAMQKLKAEEQEGSRLFGKQKWYKHFSKVPATKFELRDVKFLHELLISYGPKEFAFEDRVRKITPHFSGKFTKDQVKKRTLQMLEDYGSQSSLFRTPSENKDQKQAKEQKAAPRSSKTYWSKSDANLMEKILSQIPRTSKSRFWRVIKAFNGKFSTKILMAKIAEHDKMNPVEEEQKLEVKEDEFKDREEAWRKSQKQTVTQTQTEIFDSSVVTEEVFDPFAHRKSLDHIPFTIEVLPEGQQAKEGQNQHNDTIDNAIENVVSEAETSEKDKFSIQYAKNENNNQPTDAITNALDKLEEFNPLNMPIVNDE